MNGGDDDGGNKAFMPTNLEGEALLLPDRTWLRLQILGRSLLFAVPLIIVLLLLFFFWRLHDSHRSANMQKAYGQLATREGRINFIAKYEKYRLAGFAALLLGDDYLASGDYKLAQLEYERAAKILKSTIALPRAEIGRAMANYGLGNFEEAEKILNLVIRSGDCDKIYRGKAACVLVGMLKDRRDLENLDQFLENISTFNLSPKSVELIRSMAHRNDVGK
ncbi:MAG: tetratricopeptide repeat protein [Puniceicoccales bacterium]|jgi:tetratricopeptide (TPR) repeat protein|nr:tetratricopeptide repeat protein [Puniceicoccales bacterium]